MSNNILLLIGALVGALILIAGKFFFKRRRKSIFDTLLEEIASYVSDLFDQHWHEDLVYHDLRHTRRVVERTKEISAHYRLELSQKFVVLAAAWFHDTGQLVGPPNNHEERSVRLMEQFVLKKGIDLKIIYDIARCIRATTIPHSPNDILEEIICDGDTYNLGTEEFLITDNAVAMEMKKRVNADLVNWDFNTLNFLNTHRYFTPYCKSRLHVGKQKNIRMVEERIKITSK